MAGYAPQISRQAHNRNWAPPLRDLHKSPSIQTKLEIGKPGDKYEKQADAVADKVMMAPYDRSNMVMMAGSPDNPTLRMKQGVQMIEEPVAQMMENEEEDPMVQMMGHEEEEEVQMMENEEEDPMVQMMGHEEEEQVQMMENEEEDPMVQMMEHGEEEDQVQMECMECDQEEGLQKSPAIQKSEDGSTHASTDLTSRIQSTKGQGRALSGDVQQEMGSKIGADFSKVTIHTDSEAIQMSQDLGAKAFTHGNDIYFNKGQYNPSNSSGKHLLAHELTHTVQQNPMISRQETDDVKVCGPDISQVIANHLTDFVSQVQGDLSFIWYLGASELQGYARGNGPKIREAADTAAGCPVHTDCSGTYTVGGHCISGYHIDHILIMSYLEASYGAGTARSAGQYNESFWLGALTEGFWFEGSSDAISDADLNFNEIAICLGEKMQHADENDDVTDVLTTAEIAECFEGADMDVIGNKPSSNGGSTSYGDCAACMIGAPAPTNLELPPIDL